MKTILQLISKRITEISFGFILSGMIFMMTGNHQEFQFSWVHITLAPILLITGYILVAVSIMKKTEM